MTTKSGIGGAFFYDGYDISEYENVHKDYGTLDDFKV